MCPELSVVVPVYNEEDVLPLLADRLRPVLDGCDVSYEVVAVDDGSTDASAVVLQRLRRDWPQIRIVRLRANSGHQAAISAGLARSRGDYVVTIDADLQDPPEVIADMLAVARSEGVDVVYGVRGDRTTDTAFKRGTARMFYATMRAVSRTDAPPDAGDFRLMSRATVDAVNALPEHHRVLRFVVPALGFPSAQVTYKRDERAAGRSKYPLAKMIALSIDGLTSHSMVPLRLATWCGLLGGVFALCVLVYALISRLSGHYVAGWASQIVTVSAVGAVQLLCLGLLGEYVGRMYMMMQGIPTYFVAYDSAEIRREVRPGTSDAPGLGVGGVTTHGRSRDVEGPTETVVAMPSPVPVVERTGGRTAGQDRPGPRETAGSTVHPRTPALHGDGGAPDAGDPSPLGRVTGVEDDEAARAETPVTPVTEVMPVVPVDATGSHVPTDEAPATAPTEPTATAPTAPPQALSAEDRMARRGR